MTDRAGRPLGGVTTTVLLKSVVDSFVEAVEESEAAMKQCHCPRNEVEPHLYDVGHTQAFTSEELGLSQPKENK